MAFEEASLWRWSMLELMLSFLADLLLLRYFDDLSDNLRLIVKVVIYILAIIGVAALMYYVFIR